MAIGTVKWFNNAKGYGFILPDGGGEDLFAHYSSIQMNGYKTLKAGQPVEFEIIEGPKGLQATNIQAAEGAAAMGEAPETAGGGAALEMDDGAAATSEVLSVTVEDAPAPEMLADGGQLEPSKASSSN